MYSHVCPMMQSPCWCYMFHCMPIMNYPMMMPKYEFEEQEKKKCKRENIEFDEYAERETEKPYIPQKPIPVPEKKTVQPITHIETEQEIINIVNKVEVEAPDVINKLIALGLTLEAARQLIKMIIKATKKCDN